LKYCNSNFLSQFTCSMFLVSNVPPRICGLRKSFPTIKLNTNPCILLKVTIYHERKRRKKAPAKSKVKQLKYLFIIPQQFFSLFRLFFFVSLTRRSIMFFHFFHETHKSHPPRKTWINYDEKCNCECLSGVCKLL
jgi:hypothetical protein